MRDLYVGLVEKQKRTCDPSNKTVPLVPKKWRKMVIEDLTALGLDLNGFPVEIPVSDENE